MLRFKCYRTLLNTKSSTWLFSYKTRGGYGVRTTLCKLHRHVSHQGHGFGAVMVRNCAMDFNHFGLKLGMALPSGLKSDMFC